MGDKGANVNQPKSYLSKTQFFCFLLFFGWGEGSEGENPLKRKEVYHITEAFSSLENSSPECQLFGNKWLHKAGLPSVGRRLSSAFTHHYENVTTVTSFLKNTKQNRVHKAHWEFGKHVL